MENNNNAGIGTEFVANDSLGSDQNNNDQISAQDAAAALQGEDAQNPEVGAEEAQSEEKKEDPISRKFAALSRKEKAISQREARIKQMEAEYEAKLKELESPSEPEINFEDMLKRDPIGALAHKGLDVQKLADIILNDGKLPQDMQMQLLREEIEKGYQSKFSELEQKLAEREKQEEEERYNSQVENFKQEIESTITSDNEKWELINAMGDFEGVYDLIVQYHNDTIDEEGKGLILSTEEAADMYEQYLYEEASKILKAKKFKGLFDEPKEPGSKEEQKQESVTLTNENSAQAPTSANDAYLSNDESIARAAKMLKWND